MRFRNHLRLILQLAILITFWLVGEAISRFMHLPLPGGIIGMFLLLIALQCGWVKVESVERGSHLLLTEMLLFFVPAVLVVRNHGEFLGREGLEIVAVIVVSTLLVMAATGLTIEFLSARSASEGQRDHS